MMVQLIYWTLFWWQFFTVWAVFFQLEKVQSSRYISPTSLPCEVSIIDSGTKLNETLIQRVGNGCHTLIHDHIGLTIGSLQINDVSLRCFKSLGTVLVYNLLIKIFNWLLQIIWAGDQSFFLIFFFHSVHFGILGASDHNYVRGAIILLIIIIV